MKKNTKPPTGSAIYTERLHILITRDLQKKLQKIALQKEINQSNLIRMWLNECVEREESK